MKIQTEDHYLLKFVGASAISFLIGSIHGVLQVVPPIRAWLDSIGSPYGGPGHMIDPLAHAHINLIGGVTLFIMGASYYLITAITKAPLYSKKMANQSFWLATIGIYSFYTTLMIFGTWEGFLLLDNSPKMESISAIAGPMIAITATVMGIGLWMYIANILLTLNKYRKSR